MTPFFLLLALFFSLTWWAYRQRHHGPDATVLPFRQPVHCHVVDETTGGTE